MAPSLASSGPPSVPAAASSWPAVGGDSLPRSSGVSRRVMATAWLDPSSASSSESATIQRSLPALKLCCSAPLDARSAERCSGFVRGATNTRLPTSNDPHARATIPMVTGIFVPIKTTRTSPKSARDSGIPVAAAAASWASASTARFLRRLSTVVLAACCFPFPGFGSLRPASMSAMSFAVNTRSPCPAQRTCRGGPSARGRLADGQVTQTSRSRPRAPAPLVRMNASGASRRPSPWHVWKSTQSAASVDPASR